MSSMILGTVEGSPAGGTIPVRLPGAPTVVSAQATWQCDGVTSGCQVLVATEGGRLWAVALVGAKGGKPGSLHPSDTAGTPLAPEQVGGWGGQSGLPPSWSGTWRGGAWRTDTQNLVQGAAKTGDPTNMGAAFYPVAAWGTLVDGQVRLRRLPGGNPTEAPLTMALLQGGATEQWPTIVATAAGPRLEAGGETRWQLPADWLPQLSSGAAGGIGLTGDTFAVIDGALMDLSIQWTRTVT